MKHIDRYNNFINESIDIDIDKFINRNESYVEVVGSILYSSKDEESEWWQYLGESNTGQWSKNISNLLENQSYRQMSNDELTTITNWLYPILSRKTNNINKCVVTYPRLKRVENCRFENCWFMIEGKDFFGFTYGWDMCVQGFSDEWYLVNVGDGLGSRNYCYRVDTLEGLNKFINKMFIDPYKKSKSKV